MQDNKVQKFASDGWCSHESADLTTAIEALIDEISGLSHAVFGRTAPKLATIEEKSDYLARSVSEMASSDRKKLSFVYDGIKNLPAFHALYGHGSMTSVCQALLKSRSLISLKDSVGIRIDIPGEETQLTEKHQEFHSFPMSLNGLVVWCPLTRVNPEAGTIALWNSTHKDLLNYSGDNQKIEELKVQGKFQEAQKQGALAVPDDLGAPIIVDATVGTVFFVSALSLHQSVPASNSSHGARLTCQMRVFSYDDDFFAWKARSQSFLAGLKQPLEAQAMYDEWMRDADL